MHEAAPGGECIDIEGIEHHGAIQTMREIAATVSPRKSDPESCAGGNCIRSLIAFASQPPPVKIGNESAHRVPRQACSASRPSIPDRRS
jgi:hypothetical protein